MSAIPTNDAASGRKAENALRNWIMVALTLILALMYWAALMGWLKAMPDERMIARLEPIIFLVIGYYFGRLPSQQNEQTLREEINRQKQKADAAQHAKEHAQQSSEALEEKVKNARAALSASAPGITPKGLAESLGRSDGPVKEDALRHAVAAALKILNS